VSLKLNARCLPAAAAAGRPGVLVFASEQASVSGLTTANVSQLFAEAAPEAWRGAANLRSRAQRERFAVKLAAHS
jgi:hypothetical protein